MNNDEFQIYTNDILDRVEDNLVQKADRDYATDEDRLYNFHSAAPILGSAEKACLAYATKHFMSVAKMVNDGKKVTREFALEKLGDMATYMVLLYALMMEGNEDEAKHFACTDDPISLLTIDKRSRRPMVKG